MIDDRRRAAQEAISGFEKQGYTGFRGHMLHKACRCAFGVRFPELRTNQGLWNEYNRTPEDVRRMIYVHDRALVDAKVAGMKLSIVGGRYRAKAGTPAYQLVVDRLTVWAETGVV